jgi:hypothetical protein
LIGVIAKSLCSGKEQKRTMKEKREKKGEKRKGRKEK